jgi:hypothetical protein
MLWRKQKFPVPAGNRIIIHRSSSPRSTPYIDCAIQAPQSRKCVKYFYMCTAQITKMSNLSSVVYFEALWISQTIRRRLEGRFIKNKLKTIRKSRFWTKWAALLEFAWRDWGKLWKTSVKIANFPAGNKNENLPNTNISQKRRYTISVAM